LRSAADLVCMSHTSPAPARRVQAPRASDREDRKAALARRIRGGTYVVDLDRLTSSLLDAARLASMPCHGVC
jgi:anti-sigma28 factor (negative regulator of flagellin synthesis)